MSQIEQQAAQLKSLSEASEVANIKTVPAAQRKEQAKQALYITRI